MSAPAKLHVVRLVRSAIRCNKDVKATIRSLGFTKTGQVRIHKNTPVVNGMLRKAIECVEVKPLTFEPSAPVDFANAITLPSGQKFFFRHDGVVAGVSEDAFLAHFNPSQPSA